MNRSINLAYIVLALAWQQSKILFLFQNNVRQI